MWPHARLGAVSLCVYACAVSMTWFQGSCVGVQSMCVCLQEHRRITCFCVFRRTRECDFVWPHARLGVESLCVFASVCVCVVCPSIRTGSGEYECVGSPWSGKERDYGTSRSADYGERGRWRSAATSLLTHRPCVHSMVTQGSLSPLAAKRTRAKARQACVKHTTHLGSLHGWSRCGKTLGVSVCVTEGLKPCTRICVD